MALPPHRRRPVLLFVALLSAAVTLSAGLRLVPDVRLVDVLTLFFGGFAAGAALVGAIRERSPDRTARP